MNFFMVWVYFTVFIVGGPTGEFCVYLAEPILKQIRCKNSLTIANAITNQ